jgi:hypothetical protein
MTKRETCAAEVRELLGRWLASGQAGELTGYLLSNSNLPGPRGNLELAWAFGDVVSELAPLAQQQLWSLASSWTAMTPEMAPTNSAEEYLPFCGTVAVGALGAVLPECCAEALDALRCLARDARWRMREGVCFALQRLLAECAEATLAALRQWVNGGDPLEMRAVAAALADPPLLQEGQLATSALELHRRIFEQLLDRPDRRSEPFKVLRQGLGFTLSVVVQAVPQEGFALMSELIASRDQDLLWIVRENLKKNRLLRYHLDEVARLNALI